MGKKITLAVLLLLVIGGAVVQNIYVRSTTQRLITSLKSVQAALDNSDITAAAAAADEFGAEWEKDKKMFEALFEHGEVDSISSSVKRLKSYCRTGSSEEALACVSETIFYIQHIKEIDTLGWENIF